MKSVTLFALVALPISAFAQPPAPAPALAPAQVATGPAAAALLQQAQTQSDLNQAMLIADQLIAQFPQAPEVEQALAIKAEAQVLLGNYGEAATIDEQLLQMFPQGSQSESAENRLINSLIEENRPGDALAAWDRAATNHPARLQSADAMMQRADALLASGDEEQSAASYLDIINRFTGAEVLPRAHLAAGLCLEHLDRWSEALPIYENLMRQWPQSPEARLAGDRSLAIRRFMGAVESFR